MNNITKLAPYAYLARRSDTGTIFDLYLLVPVDSEKTVELDKVQPTKGPGTRILIPYPTTEPGTPTPPPRPPQPEGAPPPLGPAPGLSFQFRHWEIDSEGTYRDICIRADGREDLTTLIAFADADPEPVTTPGERLTFTPYMFLKKYVEGEQFYSRPSCIVLFDYDAGVQEEELTLHVEGATLVITPGDNHSTINGIGDLTINRNLRHKTSGPGYIFKVIVQNYPGLNKPSRRGMITSTGSRR